MIRFCGFDRRSRFEKASERATMVNHRYGGGADCAVRTGRKCVAHANGYKRTIALLCHASSSRLRSSVAAVTLGQVSPRERTWNKFPSQCERQMLFGPVGATKWLCATSSLQLWNVARGQSFGRSLARKLIRLAGSQSMRRPVVQVRSVAKRERDGCTISRPPVRSTVSVHLSGDADQRDRSRDGGDFCH